MPALAFAGVVTVPAAVVEALRYQRRVVEQPSLRSPLYAALLDAALADVARGGPVARVLAATPADLDPLADAVALRFLGALHRVVLDGRAPALAPWFPTVGGDRPPDDPALAGALVATVAEHAAGLAAGLAEPVQTNEVSRSAAFAVGFCTLLRRFRLPLRLLELGASAGLNLLWDRWRYETGETAWGDPAAPLRFGADLYRRPFPDLSAPLGPGEAVVERRGCDRSPIDPSTPVGARLLRSFVWPDQADRHARLDAALAAAAEVPVALEAADAAEFVARHLAAPVPGCTTVVCHSVVWQYLPEPTRVAVVAALEDAGARATDEAPVAWLRMEPGEVPADPDRAAELRLRAWPGGEDRLLARSGYHGRPVVAVDVTG